jgi:hypothetical protein
MLAGEHTFEKLFVDFVEDLVGKGEGVFFSLFVGAIIDGL